MLSEAPVDAAVVAPAHVVTHQHARPIRPFPPEQFRLADGMHAGTVEIEVFHPAAREIGGNRRGVAEGVGRPVHWHVLGREVEELLHIIARVQQMATERLAAREVLVPLHPMAGGYFPPPFTNPPRDFLQHLRIVCFNDAVNRGLTL